MPRVNVRADYAGLTVTASTQPLYLDAAQTVPVPLPQSFVTDQSWYANVGSLVLTVQDSSGSSMALSGVLTYGGVLNLSPHIDTIAIQSGSTPGDFGFIEWSTPPDYISGGSILTTAGTMYVVRIPVRQTRLVSAINLNVTAVGVGLTSAQCFALLYQGVPGGALLGASASQHTAWQSTGVVASALTTPVQIPAGYVYAGFYANAATTLPTFARSGTVAAINGGLVATSPKYGSANTTLTTTPPGTLGVMTNTAAIAYWVALS